MSTFHGKRVSKLRTASTMLAAMVLCAAVGQVMGESPTVYFFSPETNINNFSSLKTEFDTYFGDKGKFQPFKGLKTFEKEIADKKNGVFLVSSWHYQKLRRENMELVAEGKKPKVEMAPALVGVLKNQITQRRIFSSKRKIASLASLKGKKIASAGTKEYTRQVLAEMLGADNRAIVDSFKILTVPKDIDALMAVSFGMAKAAITTEASVTKLSKVNKKLHGSLKTLAASEGTLLPIIAVPAGATKSTEKLLDVLLMMGMDSDGRKRLKMIGLEGWKTLTEDEKRRLDK
jgi:ABC-type amino acid transport substrate-binding protein